MTDIEQAFLQAIRHQPDDNTPRLLYADWLDEQGRGDRAEFVRIQCALARLPETLEHLDRRLALQERARQLLAAHEHEWVTPTQLDLTWRRGFLDEVTITTDDDPAELDALAAQHPLSSLVCVGSLGRFFGPDRPELPWLAHLRRLALTLEPDWTLADDDWFCPLLDRLANCQLDELAIDSPHGALDIDLLALVHARPFFFRLRTIHYTAGLLNGQELARWLRSLGQCQLRELYFTEPLHDADEVFAALTDAELAQRWQGLELSLGRESAADLSRLAACVNLQTLELRLRDYWYRRPGLPFPDLPQLRRLGLTVLGENVEADLAALAVSSVVPQLTECRLDVQRFAAQYQPAREWRPLHQLLARLHTSCADLTMYSDEFQALLATAQDQPGSLQKIRRLSLFGRSVTPIKQLATLFVPTSLACLQGLSYSYHHSPPDPSVTSLLTNSDWPFVTALQLTGTRLGDDELMRLLQRDRFPRLMFLACHRCAIGDAELSSLAAWPGLAQLQELQIDGNAYSEAGLLALAQSNYLQPGTRIVCNGGSEAVLARLRQRVGPQEVIVVS